MLNQILLNGGRSFRRAVSLLVLLLTISFMHFLTLAQKKKPKERKSKELVALVEPQYDPNNWREFQSTDGRFSVVAPGIPAQDIKELPSPEGNISLHTFIVDANAEYGVTYADYRSQIEGTERLAEFLKAVRDAGVKGINGRLLDEKEIVFDGHAGRFYRVEFGDDFVMNTKMFVVGNRLYLVTATTYGRRRALSEVVRSYEGFAARFIESFKLILANQ